MILFIQYPPCSTCQKAKKWLDSHKIAAPEEILQHQRFAVQVAEPEGQASHHVRRGAATVTGYRRDAGEAPHPCNREGHPHRLQRGRLGENIVIYAFTAS